MVESALGVLAALLYFSIVVWAGLLWGAIWLLERDNPYNKFFHALIYSAIRILIDVAMVFLGVFGIAVIAAYFTLAVRMLVYHYELSVWKAVGVVGLVIATPFVVMPQLADWIDNSGTRFIIVLLGLPTGILATWLIGITRRHYGSKTLPEARVVSTKRAVTQPMQPSASGRVQPVPASPSGPHAVKSPSGPQPAVKPAPSGPQAAVKPATPVTDPASISQPIVPLRSSKPEIEIPAAPSDGPRFLR